MRNRIVPLSLITQSQNNQDSTLNQHIQNREPQLSNNENLNNTSNQNINDLSSLQQLNLFLEKMDLDKKEENGQKKNTLEQQQEENQISKSYLDQNKPQPQVIIQRPQSEQINVLLCKICLEDNNEPNNLLITPCKCQGSVGYIHQECLKTWIISQGYDLLSPIKCELCNEEYEMEIEISSKFMPMKACSDTKCIQLVSFFWLVIFMIGNICAIVVLLYYQVMQYFLQYQIKINQLFFNLQDSNDSTQWGYVIMAIAILFLFEIALVLLVKHQIQEIFFGLYVNNWYIISINQRADQMQNDNNNNQQLNKDKDKSEQTGGQIFNNNYMQWSHQQQIRILESRSVLSNQNQDVFNQNGNKIPSRLSHSRNTNQQDNHKAQNYSLKMNNEMQNCNSNQQSLQKKSMTLSQMKAHLGLDDEDDQDINKKNINHDNEQEEEEEEQDEEEEKEESKENNFNQKKSVNSQKISQNDEKIINFIRNNKQLYNHIIQSYNKMDNQFILQNNEVSKEIIVEVPIGSFRNSHSNLSNVNNFKKSADKFNDLHQQEKILIYQSDYFKSDKLNQVASNQNNNQRSQSAFQLQQQLNSNFVQSKSHHLVDIFKKENQNDFNILQVDKSLFNSRREQNQINQQNQILP